MGALIEINTDGLAKLAEIVGDWTGLNARGRERMADAEAYAEVRKVDTQNAIALARLEGEEQVARHIYARESRKMNNVRQIVDQAKTQFSEGEQVSSEPVNQDWQNRFFSIVEDVSDKEMQKLWAQILAGEIKRPKSYSMRTLDTLRNMTKEDAELFVVSTSYLVHNECICTEKEFGISLIDALKLTDMGVLSNEALTLTFTIPAHSYNHNSINQTTMITFYNDSDSIIKCTVDIKILTTTGKELLKLIPCQQNDIFINSLADFCKSKGCSKVTKNEIINWESDTYQFKRQNETEI